MQRINVDEHHTVRLRETIQASWRIHRDFVVHRAAVPTYTALVYVVVETMKQPRVFVVPPEKMHVLIPDGDRVVSVEWLEPAEARVVQLGNEKVVVYREREGYET
jgi:hypothetical protein